MNSIRNIIYGSSILVIAAASGVLFHKLFHEQYVLREMLTRMEGKQEDIAKKVVSVPQVMPRVVDKVIAKNEVWRPIQERVKDTVVQVFAQIAELDMLQPYKTPAQGLAYGSGFFINDEGYLITNAHVVSQAKALWIQIPSLGKRIIDVSVVGMSPERDLALCKVDDDALELIRKELGGVSYLPLGDSDLIHRSDEVLALGYPLGQQSLKSTTGVISGKESHFIQMSAPINPGNSGGPLLNVNGEVIGINTAIVPDAQNVGYIIPINDLKLILPDLYKIKLLHKPFLGILYNNASESLTEFLGNPQPGGCYVVEVVKNSTLYKAGVQRGDMIYTIDGYAIDVYGDMSVPWCEDKISIADYVSRLSLGDNINLLIYRNGQKKEIIAKLSQTELPAIRKVYPGFELIDYEVIAGMVVMELTMNHIVLLAQDVPGLTKYTEMSKQTEQVLVITHIFPTSQLYRLRVLPKGATINEVNGVEVRTLDDFRNAVKKSIGGKFLTIRASDNVARASDNVFVTLSFDKVLDEEPRLARDYRYPLSDITKELIAAAYGQNQADQHA